VLVGGFGTRLRPLTFDVPKPMLPVGHVAIIERLVGGLARGGVTEVTLALGFRPQPFIQAFPDSRCGGATLRYAVEPEPLDTGGAIAFAARASGIDDTFLAVNGDVLTDLDVGAMVARHRTTGAEATMHLIPVVDPSPFGVAVLDGEGRVERFVEKPAPGTAPSDLINAGTYVLEPSVLDRIAEGVPVSIERATFPAVVADRGLFGHPTDDYWIDTGRPDTYLAANLDVLSGRRAHDRCEPIDPSAAVDPTADVTGSLVGAGATIGAGARVNGSVILPGARIDEGADVNGSIIAGRVGVRARVRDVVLGRAGVIDAGEEVDGERRPSPDSPPPVVPTASR